MLRGILRGMLRGILRGISILPGGDDELTAGNVEEKRREGAGPSGSESRHRIFHIYLYKYT